MLRIRDLTLGLDEPEEFLYREAARALHLSPRDLQSLAVVRRAVDARKKDNIRLVYTVDVVPRGESAARLGPKVSPVRALRYEWPHPQAAADQRPVVAGFGPGGIFAALLLAEAGLRPLVLERGLDVDTRRKKVEEFWRTGHLDPNCNVQFGEGGAGTFSDGKLNTGIHDPRVRWVLEQFHAAGAQDRILTDAKPHIGTDVLSGVVKNLRRRIERLGGEVRFGCRLTGLEQEDGALRAVRYEEQGADQRLACQHLILAIGHSARDTFAMLEGLSIPMERKPFSMGVRIEHSQRWLDAAQYGPSAGHPRLPPADYKLSVHLPDGSSAYTFCMCPGGQVVAAASETGGVVTNGMSGAARDGGNCNAALLVTLHPADFPGEGVLAGMEWQRALERAAFQLSGSYRAPAQLAGDFLAGRPSAGPGTVLPSYRPGVIYTDLRRCLPEKITGVLTRALPLFDRRLRGFSQHDAVLTAPETRSSCPVRILRDGSCQSQLRGLYPCGEGAGYAGGITSAAVDGLRCAEALLANLSSRETVQKLSSP